MQIFSFKRRIETFLFLEKTAKYLYKHKAKKRYFQQKIPIFKAWVFEKKKRYRLVSNWIPYWSPLIFFFLLRIYKEKMVRRLIPRNIWSIQIHGFNLVHLNIVAICVFFLFWLANFQNPKNATTKNKWLSDTFEFWEAINFSTTKYGAWVQMLKKTRNRKVKCYNLHLCDVCSSIC